jgi:hypothetical protein
MKSDSISPQSNLPRRGWLGAAAAAVASLLAWKAGTRAHVTANATMPREHFPATPGLSRASVVVKPSPDSVKRHG